MFSVFFTHALTIGRKTMDEPVNVIEEIHSIAKRLKKGDIRPELAKSELHYLINASGTIEELNAAYAAYSQIGLGRKAPVSIDG